VIWNIIGTGLYTINSWYRLIYRGQNKIILPRKLLVTNQPKDLRPQYSFQDTNLRVSTVL